jgi:hypothetical protein
LASFTTPAISISRVFPRDHPNRFSDRIGAAEIPVRQRFVHDRDAGRGLISAFANSRPERSGIPSERK